MTRNYIAWGRLSRGPMMDPPTYQISVKSNSPLPSYCGLNMFNVDAFVDFSESGFQPWFRGFRDSQHHISTQSAMHGCLSYWPLSNFSTVFQWTLPPDGSQRWVGNCTKFDKDIGQSSMSDRVSDILLRFDTRANGVENRDQFRTFTPPCRS